MSEHEITVSHMVLHILDPEAGVPVLSNREIDPSEDGFDFTEKLIRKMLDDENLKNAVFFDGPNRTAELCASLFSGATGFLDATRDLAGGLFAIMSQHPEIPAAGLICCLAEIDGVPYLGLLKLNYRSNFTHQVQYEGNAPVNLLFRQRAVLPGENQKPDEGVLINLQDRTLRLVEKQHELDGEKEYYLSKRFLGCGSQLSSAEKAKILNRVAVKLGKKYNNEKLDSSARLRKSVTEHLETGGEVALTTVAQEIFRDAPTAQEEYVSELKEAGIREEKVQFSEKLAARKFKNQKIKTDTGVEIEFPATHYMNKDLIEFVPQPNGTLSIIIKNVGKITDR